VSQGLVDGCLLGMDNRICEAHSRAVFSGVAGEDKRTGRLFHYSTIPVAIE